MYKKHCYSVIYYYQGSAGAFIATLLLKLKMRDYSNITVSKFGDSHHKRHNDNVATGLRINLFYSDEFKSIKSIQDKTQYAVNNFINPSFSEPQTGTLTAHHPDHVNVLHQIFNCKVLKIELNTVREHLICDILHCLKFIIPTSKMFNNELHTEMLNNVKHAQVEEYRKQVNKEVLTFLSAAPYFTMLTNSQADADLDIPISYFLKFNTDVNADVLLPFSAIINNNHSKIIESLAKMINLPLTTTEIEWLHKNIDLYYKKQSPLILTEVVQYVAQLKF